MAESVSNLLVPGIPRAKGDGQATWFEQALQKEIQEKGIQDDLLSLWRGSHTESKA